ncbi:MAG: hypothetical protein ACFFG0_16115 [Candidatus Thorarchaeota archaeon]
MLKIKNNSKLIILIITTLSIISFLTPRGMCDTTIGISTIPVEEGDFYEWKLTYCHPNISAIYGDGSYLNLTIEMIEQGSYGPMADALIVSTIYGQYRKGNNTHISSYEANWLVYNATFNYLYIDNPLLFIPIPLNLTMVGESINAPYAIDGNIFTIFPGSGFELVYKFNSDGFASTIIAYYDSEIFGIYSLVGINGIISFGNYYILVSILAVICVVILVHKQQRIEKKK